MNESALLVPLSKIASPIARTVPVLPGTLYRTIGVKWWGEGAYERQTIDGSQTVAKTLSLVRENDLIINKIWVRHGSTAIASANVDGCAASSEFPTFELDQTQVLPQYLYWLTKTRNFWDKCDALSRGTSGKNRIKPELFLTIEIPLPLLPIQQRIIARIETLAAKITEARNSRLLADNVMKTFQASIITSALPEVINQFEKIKFGALIHRYRVVEQLDPDKTYNGVGTRMWGQGVYIHEQKKGSDFNAERYTIKSRQLVYNEVWAHNGAIGVVPDHFNDIVVSRHFHVFDVDWERISSEFLGWIFRSAWFWNECQAGSVGTSGRGHMRRQHLENILLPLPPLPEQHRAVAHLKALQAKLDTLKTLQGESQRELDALLPAVLDRAFKGEL